MPPGEIERGGVEDGHSDKHVSDSCQAVPMVTACTPTNIAVIKYWGKRNDELILPLNSSLSVTLNPEDLAATTTVAVSESYERDRLWLNGKEVSVEGVRYQNCLREIRARAQDVVDEKTGKVITRADWQRLHVHIVSVNNFPTAAGLASSAAGFACLVYALAKLMGVRETFPGELSAIARMGSGSACRSLYGGFVKWEMGCEEDGRDSIAMQLADYRHWPDLRVLIAVVSDRQKDTTSTSGMQQTVRTSPLLQHRVKEVVPQRIKAMEQAILARDFAEFARLTMTDSNQFHATCLDTSPPIFYLNDTSRKLIAMVERWNKFEGRPMAAYTFDAGPNAVLFTTAKNLPSLIHRLLYYFPPHPSHNADWTSFFADTELLRQLRITSCEDILQLQDPEEETISVSGALNHGLRQSTGPDTRRCPGELQYIISTAVGHGPRLLDSNTHALLDVHTGLPAVKGHLAS